MFQSTDTQFEDIPCEIIVSKIFANLSSCERQKDRAVCASWKSIIDNFFGQEVHITNKNWDSLTSSQDIVHARFTNWTRDLGLHVEPRKFTMRIKILELFSPLCPIHYYSTLPLLKSCYNLSTLVIGNIIGAFVQDFEKGLDTTLEEWKFTHDPTNEVWFPNLETFKFIDNWESRSGSLGSYAQGCCIRNSEFLTFLFSKLALTKLKGLEVQLHNSFWWISLQNLFTVVERDHFEAFGPLNDNNEDPNQPIFNNEQRYNSLIQLPLTFLGNTLHTLNFVEIQYHKILTVQCHFHSGTFAINGIRQLNGFRSYISKEASEGKCLRLKYLQAQEIHNLWADILNTQFSLREFDGQLTFDTPDHLLPILSNNVCTLKNTRILTTQTSIQDDADVAEDALWDRIDFHPFQKQQQLTHLSFVVDMVNPEELCICHPFFKHLKHLPDSLIYLELSCPIHLTMFEGDTSLGFCGCLGHLKNLKELILWNRSCSSDYNLPWFLINNIIKVSKLCVSHVEAFIKNFPKLAALHFNWCCRQSQYCCGCSCNLCNAERGVEGNVYEGLFDKNILKMKHVMYFDPVMQTEVIKKVRIMDGMCTQKDDISMPRHLCINIKTL